MAARVLFHRVVQDEPEFGSTDARSISRMFFDLEVDGEMFSDLHVDVEELVGSSHMAEEIDVGKLKDAPVSIDRKAFEQANYYQSLVTGCVCITS